MSGQPSAEISLNGVSAVAARTIWREADRVDGRAVLPRQREGRLPGQALVDSHVVVAAWHGQQTAVRVPGEQAACCGCCVHLHSA